MSILETILRTKETSLQEISKFLMDERGKRYFWEKIFLVMSHTHEQTIPLLISKNEVLPFQGNP